MNAFQLGFLIAAILAGLTVLEYIFAVEITDDTVRFLGLVVAAIGKTGLILWYFMHIKRIWAAEGAH